VDVTKEAVPAVKETCSAPSEDTIFFGFGNLKRPDFYADRFLLSNSGKRDVKRYLRILKRDLFLSVALENDVENTFFS
jgi:hypothetical protein